MYAFNLFVFVTVAVSSYTMAAPKPFSLEEVGRSIQDFGQKALPAVKGVCGFVNGYQGYPQGYPAPAYPVYPQGYHPQQAFPVYYPQVPQYPAIPPNFPPTKGGGVPGVATEQDDLNGANLYSGITRQNNVPPQIQDVFKNFNNLPTVNLNTVRNNQVLDDLSVEKD